MKRYILIILYVAACHAWIHDLKRWIRNDLSKYVRKSALIKSSTVTRTSPSLDSRLSTNRDSNKLGQRIIGPIFLFLLSISSVDASPLNPQLINIRGPFFQGWLIRTTDHKQSCSFITIIGSFSKSLSNAYTEHYLFCGIQHGDQCYEVEMFPSVESVTITGSMPSSSSFFSKLKPSHITWSAKDVGFFRINDEECEVKFTINGCDIHSISKLQTPWKVGGLRTDGPEGWLGYTPLLPCHYHIHSTGSICDYSLSYLGKFSHLQGQGYSHIEGNHGTFFPDGWAWAQAVAPDNHASLSVVGGLFEIGPMKPMNFVIYLRYYDHVQVFRTSDADRIRHNIDYSKGTAMIEATSLSGSTRLILDIHSLNHHKDDFGHPIYIPTAKGFSNSPGCRETYTATATARLYRFDGQEGVYKLDEEIVFQQVAFEFGGMFQQHAAHSSLSPSIQDLNINNKFD